MNDYGYAWNNLIGRGINWPTYPLACSPQFGAENSVWATSCGFGCGVPKDTASGVQTLYGAASDANKFCKTGCPIPFKGTADPFIEFTEFGFRGYDIPLFGGDKTAAEAAVCGRTCSWYTSLSADTKQQWITANERFRARLAAGVIDPNNPFGYGGDASSALFLSQAEADLFDAYCAAGNASQYGFPGREIAYKDQVAPQGGYWWWNGVVQYWPNLAYQDNVLRTAQTAYFTGVVVSRTADLLVCKTRKESLFTQGMRNRVLNIALFTMIAIVCLLSYVPFLRIVWGTRPLYVLYLFVGLPYTMAIFVYDEVRKGIIRAYPKGWVYRNTYW